MPMLHFLFSVFIFVAMNALTHAQAIGFNFEEANADSGILFIPTNMVQLSYDKWHLCYYFDLSLYYQETAKITECVNELRLLCNDGEMAANEADSHLCRAVVLLFEEHLGAMSVNDEIVNSFRTQKVRTRRAPLEFVGQVLSAVFGTLDAKDASKYNADIERLKNDDKYQFELLKQQTTIVEGTIRANEYSINEVRDKVSELTKNLAIMKEYWSRSSNHLHLKGQFNMLTSVANLILLHHSNTAETVINLLSNSIHGKMTNMIPISHLKTRLYEIAKTLGKNQELPIDVDDENVYQIFSVSEINSILIDDRIMLEINFPILNRDIFTLYEAISVPAPSGEKFARIAPASYHFLTDRELTKLIPVSSDEREHCWHRRLHSTIICSVNSPVHTNLRDNCELQLLRNPQLTELPLDCFVEEMPKRDYVVPLPQTNTYFIRLVSNMTVRTVCGNNFSNSVLSKSGLIHIQPNCVISNEYFTLVPHTVFKTVDDRTIVPSLRIGDVSVISSRGRSGEANRPALIEHTKYVFDQLANDVALAREKEDLTSQVHQLQKRVGTEGRAIWMALIGIWIGSILAIASIIIVIKWRKNSKSKCITDAEELAPINHAMSTSGDGNEVTRATTSGWINIE